MEIINIYRKNTSNTGDHFTTPTKYFDYLRDTLTLDIDELPLEEFIKAVQNKAVILGGGGLIEQDYFKEYMNALLKSKTKLLIGWAVGHNNHHGCEIIYDENKYQKRFDLLGARDSIDQLEWVPCPSCMHEIFDKRFDIKNKVVIYEHKNFALKGIDDSLPRIKNGSPFEDIISFLGSAELVVTNSYHGAYWATLLNRKVVVLQPFSSKFFGFRHPLMIANNFDDIKEITDIPTYPRALAESRDANLKFLEKVQKMIRLP